MQFTFISNASYLNDMKAKVIVRGICNDFEIKFHDLKFSTWGVMLALFFTTFHVLAAQVKGAKPTDAQVRGVQPMDGQARVCSL